jgi:TrmH family RNA methyltransferase
LNPTQAYAAVGKRGYLQFDFRVIRKWEVPACAVFLSSAHGFHEKTRISEKAEFSFRVIFGVRWFFLTMDPEVITSLQNPRVKQLVKLRDRRPRDAARQFLVEGYRQIRRALDKGFPPAELFVCPAWYPGDQGNESALIAEAAAAGAKVFTLNKAAFAKVAYRERPDGLLAVLPQWKNGLNDLSLSPTPFLLVVEAIEKPGNLGTILRSADAAGLDGLIVCDPVTDLFNPNVVRASTGVLFSVPVVIAESGEVRAWLAAKSIRSVATTPAATQLHTEADLQGPLAIVMGSEQYGLSDEWLDEADSTVRIPMAGQADSLNVAMATIITLFEAVRQRA